MPFDCSSSCSLLFYYFYLNLDVSKHIHIYVNSTIQMKLETMSKNFIELEPVVQSIVSLTTSSRHQLVKYMPTKLSNTLLFIFSFLKKCENLLHCKRFSHFFNKNNSVFVIFKFEHLTKRYLTTSLILSNRPLIS